jgi:hypothetical protein
VALHTRDATTPSDARGVTPAGDVHRAVLSGLDSGTAGFPSADGRRLAFARSMGGASNLCVIPAEDGSEVVLAELPFDAVKGNGTASPDGRAFTLSVETSRSDVWLAEDSDPGRF